MEAAEAHQQQLERRAFEDELFAQRVRQELERMNCYSDDFIEWVVTVKLEMRNNEN